MKITAIDRHHDLAQERSRGCLLGMSNGCLR